MANSPFIHIKNLSKGYQEGNKTRQVLVDASASIAQGEFVAILGKSGSGKSTLLNIISGIDEADQGQLWLNGHDLVAMDQQARTLFRRMYIGFIFQFFNLLPTLTVMENIVLPLELNGTKAKDARQKALPILEAVGLNERQGTYPDRLSGGEQQRVAIARALINDPLLVLADEPTGNLDADTGRQVLALLDSLTRKAGKNLILVTHSRENASFADRVLRLDHGHLIETNI